MTRKEWIRQERLKGRLLNVVTDNYTIGYRGKLPDGIGAQISYLKTLDNPDLLEQFVDIAKTLDLDCSLSNARVYRQLYRELMRRMGEQSWEYMGGD